MEQQKNKSIAISGTTEEVLNFLESLRAKYGGEMKLSEVMRLESQE